MTITDIISYMPTLADLASEINQIKARNRRVEADKAWETSWSRKVVTSILTYIVVVLFFYFADLPNPPINSIVPSLAFVLSTSSLSFLKKLWLKYIYKK